MLNAVRLVLKEGVPSSQLLKYDKFLVQPFSSVRTASASEPAKESKAEKDEWIFNPDLRFKYPDFLPHPWMKWRHPIKEKIERLDMLRRRSNINIPEFCVGSIMAVTSSTFHAPLKTVRFVGICILREGTGLNSRFMLRNIVDNQGVEFLYEMYDPKIQSIEVLRLEKRIDSDLLYLRDAENHYSTFPFDMEPEYLAEGEPVPVNDVKVKLKPRPWRCRYEIKGYKGIMEIPLSARRERRLKKLVVRPTEYDLMWHYRATIPEDEQREIFAEVASDLQRVDIRKKKVKKKVEFVSPTKKA